MIATITVAMMIFGCTSGDKMYMPVTTSSKKAGALINEGRILFVNGYNAKATLLFEKAMELDKNCPVLNLWYANSSGLGNIKRAEFLAIAGDNISSATEAEQHYIKAYLANEKGNREEAINEMKAAIALHPGDKYLYRSLASFYDNYGQFENALEYAKKSYEADTTFANAIFQQGYILGRMGKTDEAEKMYKKAIVVNPDIPYFYNNYAVMLRGAGKIDDAIAMHKLAIEKGSDYSAYLYLGHCYTIKGEFPSARENYSKAYENSTNDPQKNNDLYFIACTYLYESDVPGACAILDKVAAYDRKVGNMDVEIINSVVNKGFVYLLYNDLTNAEKYINEGIALIPTLTLTENDNANLKKNAILWQGWLQAFSGKPDEAEKSLELFKNTLKDEAEVASMKSYLKTLEGIVAFSRKNWADAASLLTEANATVPSYLAGLAYLNAGNKEKARQVFTSIVANNLVGFQLALTKPFAKEKLAEMSE